MIIDRARLERELETVLGQQQEAAHILQQTIGAEKAFRMLLSILDEEDGEAKPEFIDMTEVEKIDA